MAQDLSLKSFTTSMDRVEDLQTYIDALVSFDEIEQLQEQQRELDKFLATARLRLDAIRVIQRGEKE